MSTDRALEAARRICARPEYFGTAAVHVSTALIALSEEVGRRKWQPTSERDRCAKCGYMRWHGDDCPRCQSRLTPRPTTSNADEWQLWLKDGLQGEPATGCAFLAVQIVEAIEEHQKALAREVYALAENAAARFSDLASEDTPQGHFYRGSIHEAKSIARAINAIMPYSRSSAALTPPDSQPPKDSA